MQLTHLTDENRRLLEFRRDFASELVVKPELIWPFLRPCSVKVLIVVDGLDFSEGGFGLSTFVRTLLDMPGRHVRFRITLAHISGAAAKPDDVGGGADHAADHELQVRRSGAFRGGHVR